MVYPTDEETFAARATPEFIAEGHLNSIQQLLKRIQDFFGYGGRVHDEKGLVTPVGIISPYGGTSAPDGWLLCDGASYSRTHDDYLDLYNVIGVNFGAEGPSTFHVPDMRAKFLRGLDDTSTNVRAQTFIDLATDDIYIPGHTINRTSFPVRLSSDDTMPTGLLINTTYWTILSDLDTIAFATTKANSLVPTKIDITAKGAGNLSIIPWLQHSVDTRTRSTKASGVGKNVGSYQEDAFQGHWHQMYRNAGQPLAADSAGYYIGASSNNTVYNTDAVRQPIQWGDYGTPRLAVENRSINVYVNYIIKR